jgi:cytochrome c oxidase assembly factor CtaG
MSRPYAWDFHLTTWLVLIIGVVVVVFGHRRLVRRSRHPIQWSRHDIGIFAGAYGACVLALTWPVADLAAHWSLTALVIQRLILILAVAPMLVLGIPYDVLEWITRPALVDAALNRCQRPAAAVGIVTVLIVGSTTPVLVQAQASSSLVRGLLEVVVIVAGLILWIPVLGRVPGIPRMKPMMRFGYLAAQAVVPAFLSFILILSPHPLYATFVGSKAAIDLRPLNDQQIAGFVSKLTMLIVLLTVGGIGLVTTPTSDEDISVDEHLVWADVQRHFERAERHTSRERQRLTVAAPPLLGQSGPRPEPNDDRASHGGLKLSPDPPDPEGPTDDTSHRDNPDA